MKRRILTSRAIMSLAVVCAAGAATMSSCGRTGTVKDDGQNVEQKQKSGKSGGPQLGAPGGGPVIDKTGDEVLQAMIKTIVPEFRQLEYKDKATGKVLKYNLYSPKDMDKSKNYPLVLFMADASTPGDDCTRPLTQGYGALVWATDSWQAEHPCYVLVPQFSGVAVNDAYEHTDEVDMVIGLVDEFARGNNVDTGRMYTTGQSMGGMISMYYNITYPDMFAASVFVDCHWDSTNFDELVRHKFVYITAGSNGKSTDAIEAAADAAGVGYEYDSWSAKLPQAEQDSLASALLANGDPVNIINFSAGSVLPADGKGSEHMYSFDYAYRLTPVREWLFNQKK